MKIPKTVRIGPYEYAVSYKEVVLSEACENLWGQCDYTAQTIRLAANLSPERTATAFLHECLHGLDELLHLELKEEQVEALAPALYQFLCDNRLLRDDANEPTAKPTTRRKGG